MRRWTAALLPVALLPLAACASLNTSTTEVGGIRMTDDRPVRNGGTLTVAVKSDPDKLDPSLSTTLVSRTVFSAMCEKLYDVDADNHVVPQLATALPQTSADGRTVTVSIRTGVKFSDGTPLDAQAVVTSLMRDKNLPGSARSTEIGPLTSAEAVDPHTVRLHLAQPYVPLVGVLADRAGMVMSPAALAKYGTDFTNHPSCVGPFRFVERVAGDRVVLARDPNYYAAGSVHLDKVVFKTITDGSVRLANLRSGDVQVGDQMAPVDVRSALTESALQLFDSPSLGYQGLGLNMGNTQGVGKPPGKLDGPFAHDVRVREAFELSLDRDTINKVVYQGMYSSACGPISPASALTAGPATCPGRDVAKARQLLKEAGVRTPVHVELKISTSPEDSRIGQVIQAMAKEAGFDVTLRPMEYTSMLTDTNNGHYDAYLSGWSGRLDPDGNLSSFVRTAAPLNTYGISDPTIDKLIDEGRTTSDPQARRGVYQQLVQRIAGLHSLIYLYRQKNYVVASKDVAGLKVFGDGLIRVRDAGYVA
ncbi:ABC transporter substrate-binding protein [Streptacidiphilus griseoplanus]|uniref:ABC transporter substrate-binding protein n=1 Tax=Peterkaempfera griseoplana TaxID=66896 RepID=UPI0006E19C36|nr:ABC transporter substrate-binding protein [Peterkaempfera griseoplana]